MQITHVSYSSIQLFLKNPVAWHTKYVLGIREQKTNLGALVGTSFHKYCEMKFKEIEEDICIEESHRLIDTCVDVDFGKTGSVDKAHSSLASLIVSLNDEMKTELYILDEAMILGVEAFIEGRPRGFKLPMKSFIDIIFKDKDDNLRLLDWKTKRAYSERLTPSHKLQAAVYYYQTRMKYGSKPRSMMFVEIKASRNKDGTPQIKPLIYDYEENRQELKALKYLINRTITKMTAKRQNFLPNIQDEYEGEESLERFITNYYARQIV